jgi:hypothetical protein
MVGRTPQSRLSIARSHACVAGLGLGSRRDHGFGTISMMQVLSRFSAVSLTWEGNATSRLTGGCMEDARFKVNVPHVIHETIDGEVIIINLASGNYYSAKGSGAQVWNFIQRTSSTSTAEIVAELALHFDHPSDAVDSSVTLFVHELRAEGLVADASRDDASPSPVVPAVEGNGSIERAAFEEPVLEKYTDMVDLVLLDPVHEVAETGWPKQQPGAAVAEPSA